MKYIKRLKKQLIGTLLMLSLSAPLILLALSLGGVPTLAFRAVELKMREDGSAQLLFDVVLEDLYSYRNALPMGARFTLNYNSDYMNPSNYETNEALVRDEQGDNPSSEPAFQYNPALYQEYQLDGSGNKVVDGDGNYVLIPADPYAKQGTAITAPGSPATFINNYINIDTGELNMHLVVDQTLKISDGVGLREALTSETGAGYKVFDQPGAEIVLGTLSFRIDPENLDKIPMLSKKFGAENICFGIRQERPVFGTGVHGQSRLVPKPGEASSMPMSIWTTRLCLPLRIREPSPPSALGSPAFRSGWSPLRATALS